jgi:PTH2 family peptidyl-tRNA hydrolase
VDTKQVIVMRKDLGMSPGKLAAQAAHASLLSYNITPDNLRREWNCSGTTKIVLSVYDEHSIITLYKLAVAAYLPCAIVCDEGVTEVEPGTITGMAIGPALKTEIDAITGALELY